MNDSPKRQEPGCYDQIDKLETEYKFKNKDKGQLLNPNGLIVLRELGQQMLVPFDILVQNYDHFAPGHSKSAVQVLSNSESKLSFKILNSMLIL